MSAYAYEKRSPEQLEQIAEIIFKRYTHRCNGCYIDVEGIVEDCGLRILPREGGLRNLVEGYVASDPHFIVVPEALASYAPRYRPVIAEEFCHAILEYDFLGTGKWPESANPHRLTAQQHKDIEADAGYLSLAVLFPKGQFELLFNQYLRNAPADVAWKHDKLLRYCTEKLETDFQVWYLKVAYRARDLGLITAEECRTYFSDRLPL